MVFNLFTNCKENYLSVWPINNVVIHIKYTHNTIEVSIKNTIVTFLIKIAVIYYY